MTTDQLPEYVVNYCDTTNAYDYESYDTERDALIAARKLSRDPVLVYVEVVTTTADLRDVCLYDIIATPDVTLVEVTKQ